MTNLVIASMHERGFPQADFYEGCGEMAPDEFAWLGKAPDDFFTLSRGDTLAMALVKAAERWPDARVVTAIQVDDEDEE